MIAVGLLNKKPLKLIFLKSYAMLCRHIDQEFVETFKVTYFKRRRSQRNFTLSLVIRKSGKCCSPHLQ